MAYQSLYLSFFLFSFFFLSKQISSESVTTSDGYRRGYVSFAHSLLYFFFLSNKISSGSVTTSDGYRQGYVSFAHSLLYVLLFLCVCL